MSGATYRIELEHLPGEVFEWYGRVYALIDDSYPIHTCHAPSREEIEIRCREWVADQHLKRPSETFYVGDDGFDAEMHSVKA